MDSVQDGIVDGWMNERRAGNVTGLCERRSDDEHTLRNLIIYPSNLYFLGLSCFGLRYTYRKKVRKKSYKDDGAFLGD